MTGASAAAGQSQPISEQTTAFFEVTERGPQQATVRPETVRREMTTPRTFHVPAPTDREGIDLTAVILGIIALISLLGLIPLWWLVYIRFTG